MSDNLSLLEWKPMQRNTLRGFAVVRVNQLTIRDVAVHASHGKAWAALPSKPMVDRDGNALRDASTGKLRYVPLLEWQSRDVSDRFSAAVVGVVEARHPGAVR